MTADRPTLTQLQTRHGPMLAISGDTYVTRSLQVYGEYCPAEWAALRQLITPRMTVLEIGANMGSHTIAMARACAPGPLFAFEPQQRVFQVLCANLALNDVGNVFAYPDACGDTEGFATMPLLDYSTEQNFGGVSLRPEDHPGLRVRVVPIDSLNLPVCGLMKIDVEGFEPNVLRGAAATIDRCRPVIYIENDRAHQQQEVISLISAHRYRMYWHTPPLFAPQNFNNISENVFGNVVSVNMLCLPSELDTRVQGLTEIDPKHWSSPVKPNATS